MNISQAAKASELPVKTVRYYDEIDLVGPASRSDTGYRQYDAPQIRKLTFVRRARSFGFSIEDCRGLLDLYEDQNRSSADVRALALRQLERIEARQRELQSLHDTLASLVTACHGDSRPDCPIIDHLG